MGKSSQNKHQKPDFQKSKFKIGKTKKTKFPLLTQESLKMKQITLPKQSILIDHPTPHHAKNAFFIHTLTLTKHTSETQRKDALNILKHHFFSSSFDSTVLTPMIKTIIPLMVDPAPSVRDAL
ncbi:hypothetical protein PCK1_003173, partial [Pneumocystis canis]